VVPWTAWWSRNFFLDLEPRLRPIMESVVVRLAFAMVGVVTVLGGTRDLFVVFFGHDDVRPESTPAPPRES